MLDAFGETQRDLLKALYHFKPGLSPQALVKKLGVTRTAVNQHLSALESLGVIASGPTQATGGRPTRTFCLTDKGIELFPKQYTWFTELLLQSAQMQQGDLAQWMRALGDSVAGSVIAKVEALRGEERLAAIVQLMNDLLYDASLVREQGELRIRATNCVYHALAVKFSQICQFDLALLGRLSGQAVVHERCIVRGDSCCQFAFAKRATRRNEL
jgi:predicted ArsR family transcriptional regulator